MLTTFPNNISCDGWALMQTKKSPTSCWNKKLGSKGSWSTRPPSPHRLLRLSRQQNPPYQNDAGTLLMSFLRKPMTNSLLIILMIILMNFTLALSQKSPRSTPSTQQKWRPVKPLLKNTWRQDVLSPQNPPKPLSSSSYKRRMEPYAHAKITATWTLT